MEKIVLLHGALGEKSDLEPLAKLLAINMTVYSFNFSGHGQVPFFTHFDIDQFSNELELFLTSHNINKAHIFGYSMGGYVALNLALKNKQILKSIITLGTKFNWDKKTVGLETQSMQEELLIKKSPEFADSLKRKHGLNWVKLLEKTREMMFAISEKNSINIQTLSGLNIPVLIGLGDHDNMVGLDETFTIYKSIPQSKMFVLPNSKHPIKSVNLELLGSIIRNFVKEQQK